MVLKLYEVINVILTLTYKKCFLLLLSQNDGWEGKNVNYIKSLNCGEKLFKIVLLPVRCILHLNAFRILKCWPNYEFVLQIFISL